MLGEIYLVRDRLTSEIRQADDATAARAGALLRAGKLPAGHEDRPDESQLQGGWQRRGKNIMTPRERAALPVTGTIDHYVAWLNREVYDGKMTREQKEAAGVSATLYRWFQTSPERRAARGLDP